MSQTLSLRNFDTLNIITDSNLVSDYPVGSTSITVQSSADFQGGPVLIGAPGSPSAEIVTAGAITGNSIAISATKNDHNFNEKVSMLFADHIRVYRANDQYGNGKQPDDSNFAIVSGGTIAIDGSKAETAFTDLSGVPGQWYKYTYYNPTTMQETQLSDSNAAQAGQIHYVSLDDIRSAAGFDGNRNVTDSRIAAKRDAAEKEINGALLPVYQFPLPQPTNPIIVEIAKQLAAGMLIHELYVNVSARMANLGESKAKAAREGGGSFTGLQELVMRDVVLMDAQFNEQTIDEGHGFGGYPDNTFIDNESRQNAPYFAVDKEY